MQDEPPNTALLVQDAPSVRDRRVSLARDVPSAALRVKGAPSLNLPQKHFASDALRAPGVSVKTGAPLNSHGSQVLLSVPQRQQETIPNSCFDSSAPAAGRAPGLLSAAARPAARFADTASLPVQPAGADFVSAAFLIDLRARVIILTAELEMQHLLPNAGIMALSAGALFDLHDTLHAKLATS